MELRHLRYFVAVGEEEHFGRAAQRLRVAQPALSRQIQDLEREIGFKLFDRLSRGVKISSAGKLFLEEARRILQQLNEATERAQRVARGQSGTLRVGFTENASWRGVVPDSLHLFRERYPDAELQLNPLPSLQQLEAVRSGRLDAGFMFNPPKPDRELDQLPVALHSLALAAPAAHPLSKVQEPPAARHDGRAFHLVSEARERGILRPLDVRMFPWRPEIASDRSGSVERSDDIDTRRSRHGRRFRRGNRPLAMSGRRGDIESRRPQAVVAIGSRLEKGQPVPAALQICDRRGEFGEAETG